MEFGAIEIQNKELDKKREYSDTHTMPPPFGMVVLYVIYNPLQIVR